MPVFSISPSSYDCNDCYILCDTIRRNDPETMATKHPLSVFSPLTLFDSLTDAWANPYMETMMSLIYAWTIIFYQLPILIIIMFS